jgi:hypothetical protein
MDANAQSVQRWRASRVIVVVLVLYGAACLLPCIDGGPDTQSGDPGFPDFEAGWQFGLLILLFGWGGGNNGVPWSANVFWAAGVFCLAKGCYRLATTAGVIAAALGLTTWWIRRYDTMMVGYYIWQASLLLLAVGAAWIARGSPGKAGRAEP